MSSASPDPNVDPFAEVAERLVESLSALPGLLTGEEPLERTLGRVAVLCCRTLPHCTSATIVLQRADGKPEATVSSEEGADDLNRVQIEAGRGPCIEALERDTVIRTDQPDDRWPEFSAVAGDHGIRAGVCMPIPPQGPALGSLNLFTDTEGGLTELHELIASMFAAQCALAIQGEHARERAAALALQMKEALASRAVIDQAKGVVMAQRGCTADEAFDALAKESQSANRKLREVAADVVRSAQRRR